MSASHSQEVAPEVFEPSLDREQAGLTCPHTLPRAPGVLLAGKDMLIAIGAVP